MIVSELITLLEKCPKDWIVMMDVENSLKNESLTILDGLGEEIGEFEFGVDDVLVGGGTSKGFVFLSEDLL